MSDLKLVDPHQPTALERQLLNAAANESPSAEQRLRVRQALGLPAVAAPTPPVLEAGRRALVLKGAAGGLVVVSAALLWFSGVGRTPALRPAMAQTALSVPSAPLPNPAAAATPATPATTAAEAAPEPRAAAQAPSKPAARAASAPSAAESGADLSEQLRLIDAARSAVAAGDAKSAAAAIASYGSRFPRGAFGQEAAVLRIETLDLQGNHAQAATLARSFLAHHPNSPHVSVVQRIAGRAQ